MGGDTLMAAAGQSDFLRYLAENDLCIAPLADDTWLLLVQDRAAREGSSIVRGAAARKDLQKRGVDMEQFGRRRQRGEMR